jgi:ABC-type Fe3+/spermidine/putrescine transport system ATPase subunit
MSESLRVTGLRKKIGGFELRAEFEVAPGARLAITGPSGSGKSTLLRILAGLQSLDGAGDQGGVFLGAREITSLAPQARDIGFVSQSPALFDSLNVAENAAFGLRMRGVGMKERHAAVMPWLERVGLAKLAERSVQKLSGGEQSRVAFVRALVWNPRLILLDEPFSALDQTLRSRLRIELLELHQHWPAPLILVTHDREDVEALATQTLSITDEVAGVRVIR